MKRFGIKPVSFILVIAMILTMAFPVFSGNAAVEYAFTCGEATPGEEFAVTLSVSSASTEVDGLIVYNLVYDTSVATFTGFDSYGDLVTSSAAGEASVNSDTKVINLGYSPAIVPNGTICVLKFHINENAVSGSTFTISMSASASKNRVAVSGGITPPTCTVKVKEEPAAENYVKYTFTAPEEVNAGEELAVALNVESAATLVDGLIVYNLTYDSTLAEFKGFESYGELVISSLAGEASVNANTKVINLGYSPAIVPNGTICVLKFKIAENVVNGSNLTISMNASASKDRVAIEGEITPPSCSVSIQATEPEEPVEYKKITITNFKEYTVSIDGAEEFYTTEISTNIPFDAKVIVTAVDNEDFAYWRNSANVIVSRTPEFSFYVTVAETYTAVYNTKATNKVTVIYESLFNQVMGRMQVSIDGIDSMVEPSVPTRFGYTIVGWEYSKTDIKALAENVLATEETTDDVIVVKPVYTKDAQTITVTVNGGTGSGEYEKDSVITVVAAAAPAGQKFSHWEDSEGTVLSYRTDYMFYVMKDIILNAVFVSENTEVIPAGVAAIIDIVRDVENRKISFAAFSNVPDGFTIKNAGVIATADASIGNNAEGFTVDTATYVRGGAESTTSKRFIWTKSNVGSETWYARAFLTYTDTDGNSYTVYGAVVSAALE